MINLIIRKPIVIAVILKIITYTCAVIAVGFPEFAIVFAPLAAITGTSFYLIFGSVAGMFFAKKLSTFKQRLQRDCQIGNLDSENQPIIHPEHWP